jgi:arginyl-tRNA synthetase
MLVRDVIVQQLTEAVAMAQRLEMLPATIPPGIVVERPHDPEHGDFASNLPLRLARAARMSPLEIAEKLASLMQSAIIPQDEVIERVWAAPPGFLNLALKPQWFQAQVEAINEAGASYGNVDTGAGQRLNVEFVSVNPTGPLHVGHARGAVLGSGLASVLAAAGFDVTREYYVNDAGTQMEIFYASLYARYAQALGREEALPEGGYRGQYMTDMGQAMAAEFGDAYLEMPQEQAVAELGAIGLERMLGLIRQELDRLGVSFDVWFSERDLFANNQYTTAMKLLEDQGFTAEREGAVWFTSSALGEDNEDNVIVRRTGQPTYFASDVAYHYDKLVEREFDGVIDVWGADHQGHVPRMKAVLKALDIDPERLTIIIAQLVTLKRAGATVRASKRTGEMVTLEELVDEVGPDACRYFFLARAAESQMEFDLELAVRESADNPVYYVQYAHARIAGILRLARERGITWDDGDVSLLGHEAELALVKKMIMLPELVDTIARTLAPHHLPHYATDLATAFHVFYDNCRVISKEPDDEALTKSRLKLCQAAKNVLARTLTLMGMSIPESM